MIFLAQKDDKLHALLHYVQGAERFSSVLGVLTKGWRQWCPFTHKKQGIDVHCYRGNEVVQRLISYVQKYALLCRYLDTNPFVVADLTRLSFDLTVPEKMLSTVDFESLLTEIRRAVVFVESDISAKLSRLTCLECERLDEAIEALNHYCFYSSVVMAVSSVEARIAEIIRRKNKRFFEKHLTNATLGQLIQVFDEKHYTDPKFSSLKKLLPAKHKPLVHLLNNYRVFSAHPKGESITLQLAETILKLSFTFMIDPMTCPYSKKELHCTPVSETKNAAASVLAT